MRGQIDLPVYGDYVGQVIKELRVIAGCHTMCLRFSGGKDSVVLKWLFDQAGIPYQARFSRTSVDPPELLRFIRKYHSDVIEEPPRISMFHLIIKKGSLLRESADIAAVNTRNETHARKRGMSLR